MAHYEVTLRVAMRIEEDSPDEAERIAEMLVRSLGCEVEDVVVTQPAEEVD